MKSVLGKEFCKILERKGWVLKRIQGSHHIYMWEGRKERLTIPVHGSKDLKIGLLRALMKIADVDESEL